MKKTLLILAIIGCLVAPAQAALVEHWMLNVDKDKGWYDADKNFDGTDDQLCWAAASSNIAAWWLDQNPGGKAVDGAPQTHAEIWDIFRTSFESDSGSVYGGLDWYFSGNTPDQPPMTVAGKNNGGYYKDDVISFECEMVTPFEFDQNEVFDEDFGLFLLKDSELTYANGYNHDSHIQKAFSEYICASLEQGYGFGLGVAGMYEGGMYKHAITLWGVEQDTETGLITKMWVTDSDDAGTFHQNLELIELTCTPIHLEYGFFDETISEMFTFDIKDSANWYKGYDQVKDLGDYVSDVTRFRLTANLPSVPEPCTGTLSLLALAGLCARRRRK